MTGAEVVKPPFGLFNWTVTLGIIVIVFCVVYFYLRRNKEGKRVDRNAGDEGND